MPEQMKREEEDKVEYLQSLTAIRERCHEILRLGQAGKLMNFTLDMGKLSGVSSMIIELIKRDYGSLGDELVKEDTLNRIPPHGRWRHFGIDNMNKLIKGLSGSNEEITRCVLDLFVVAVLLDAGAGDSWKFTDDDGKEICRSEGLAVATLRMFEAGKFSSNGMLLVDSKTLLGLTEDDLKKGFQVGNDNPLLGVKGRVQLLQRLGAALESHPEYFPKDSLGLSRPGCLLDYLLAHQSGDKSVHIDTLWELIINGFGRVWPESRTKLRGISLGDVWRSDALGCLVPFHKLSQWLTYSLMEPITHFIGIQFIDAEKMTGLAEYRNGGLFIDLGVISLTDTALRCAHEQHGVDPTTAVPLFPPDSQTIVEWRALTVALIDVLAEMLRKQLHTDSIHFPLPKLLEAGTWKAGREISKQLRTSGGPPIAIISDGTLF